MNLTPYALEEQPYNVCLNCVHIGKTCDGPNFLAMPTDRWCEWVRLRKDYLGWTNAKVAEISGIAKVTIDRIMAGISKDVRVTTMQAVTKALVNGTWGQYPCAMPSLSETETVYVDNPDLVEKLEASHEKCKTLERDLALLKEEHRLDLSIVTTRENMTVEHMRSQVTFLENLTETKQKMIDNLLLSVEKKNRAIWILVVALAIASILIVIVILIASANNDFGFF